MKPVTFDESNTIIAEHQDEYLPLPVYYEADGTVTSCWQLDEEEIAEIVRTGKLWLSILTFGNELQPQLPQVFKPAMPPINIPFILI